MKSLEEIQLLNNLLLKHADLLQESLKRLKRLNNQYKRNIKIERKRSNYALLKLISNDYNIDFDELVKKYINKESIEEKLLEIIDIEGKEYFYENINNGKIYNDENKIVGTYKNNDFILNC